jgi:hypothetical protein
VCVGDNLPELPKRCRVQPAHWAAVRLCHRPAVVIQQLHEHLVVRAGRPVCLPVKCYRRGSIVRLDALPKQPDPVAKPGRLAGRQAGCSQRLPGTHVGAIGQIDLPESLAGGNAILYAASSRG